MFTGWLGARTQTQAHGGGGGQEDHEESPELSGDKPCWRRAEVAEAIQRLAEPRWSTDLGPLTSFKGVPKFQTEQVVQLGRNGSCNK